MQYIDMRNMKTMIDLLSGNNKHYFDNNNKLITYR